MPSYAATVDIAAPPETVFPSVADLSRHPEWSADPLTVEPDGDAAFTSRARSKGKEITAKLTIVEQRAPDRFVFDATDMTGTWRHTFTLTPTGTGTRVRREISGSLSGGQLLLYWLVLLPIKKPNAKRALARLEQLVTRS